MDTSEFETGTHSAKDCEAILALKTKLVECERDYESMTKRAEEAERWRKHTLDVERMVDDLKVDLLAAEAKLAAARDFITELSKQPYLDRYAARFADILRALGKPGTGGGRKHSNISLVEAAKKKKESRE